MIFGLGGKYCPACSSRMNVRVTSHQAVDTEGQPVLYHGVRHYTCPRGCHTSMYDFSKAYIAGAEDGPRGWQPFGTVTDEGPFQFLMNIDLSMIIVVIGLVLGYVMFVAGILASPTSPGGKIASAALLTAGAFFILIHITSRAPEAQENGGRPQLR